MERRAEPIYSKVADDPSLGDAVDAFVVELAERVDALQDLDPPDWARSGPWAFAHDLRLDPGPGVAGACTSHFRFRGHRKEGVPPQIGRSGPGIVGKNPFLQCRAVRKTFPPTPRPHHGEGQRLERSQRAAATDRQSGPRAWPKRWKF